MDKTTGDHSDRLSEAERTILLIKSMKGTGSGEEGGDNLGSLDALEILIENLRKECYAKFAEREDLKKSNERIDELERLMKEL